jgi:toxin FitB
MVKSNPSEHVVDWLGERDENALFLSVLTLGEIQKGIAKLPDGRRKAKIQLWLDGDLQKRFADRMLTISDEVALTWGTISGDAERQGTPPVPVIVGLLDATALAHNLTLVTRNENDPRLTGVRLFNPWTQLTR